jgi:hypothetical protein
MSRITTTDTVKWVRLTWACLYSPIGLPIYLILLFRETVTYKKEGSKFYLRFWTHPSEYWWWKAMNWED